MHVGHSCHDRVAESCTPPCLHRRCVNPAHLVLQTPGENIRASATTTASLNAAKTHCVNGHPFDKENTGIRPDGNRYCKQCARDRKQSETPAYRRSVRRLRSWAAENGIEIPARGRIPDSVWEQYGTFHP